jgi:predicted porin
MFNLGEISMKKVLVAMAVLAATSAFAQSSVTLYGRLDLGLSSNKATNAAGVSTSKFDLAGAQGVRTGGRLGVRGTEDLGGGLIAGFNIETRVDPDSSASTFGTTRNGNLSLTGGFGTVVVGTYLNTLDDVRGYSAATAGVAGGDFFAKNTEKNGIAGRSTNALGYRSPSFGGFDVRLNLVSRKNQADNLVPTALGGTGTEKVSAYGLAGNYSNGPLNATVAYGGAKASTTIVAAGSPTLKVSDLAFGVSYNLGIAIPYFAYETTKSTLSVAGASSDTKVRGYDLGAKFPLGAFTPYISISGGKLSTSGTNTGKSRGYQVGTLYDISKRTYVYGAFGGDKNTTNAGTVGALDATTKNRGYALGLVHSF